MKINYYQYNKKQLADKLNTSLINGLQRGEISRRQKKYGLNRLPVRKKKNAFFIFKDQFHDFMILVLMVATVISLILGEMLDAITIFAIIILNALMGFIQEYRAEKSLQALKKMAAPQATVVREGKINNFSADELVPGDVVLLKTGDIMPADARIVETDGLQVDEAILTGESTAVNKDDKRLYTDNLAPSEQKNMLFMGTTITRGAARAVVVNTGINTQIGKIADMLGEEKEELTPLQKRLKHLGKWLVFLSIIITFLIMAFGVWQGQSIYQMFLGGVSLAVAAIPEGLPAIVTLALAIGVQKMIKRNAIVRELPAVETLGCATVICSDKTGTLTKNEMTLSKTYYNRRIRIFKAEEASKLDNCLHKILTISSLCNEAKLKEKEQTGALIKIKNIFTRKKIPELIGDPTDIAFIKALYECDLSLKDLQEKYSVLKKEAFDARRKRISVLVKKSNNNRELWIKGAPEVLLARSENIQINGEVKKLNSELKEEIIQAGNSMADEGLRVIAIAYKPLKRQIKGNIRQEENNLTILGLTGLIDPPRPEAYQAVEQCKKAGIRTIMITGDHERTAAVIAAKLGIINKHEKIFNGKKIKKLSKSKLRIAVLETNVFARIDPEDKLRIVKALKENGEIVAMTGDGVNDAPALREADIGIAMGKKGTDVSREVSSLILSDDNFATIVAAIEEGRKIYNNIRKFIRYLLSCNMGELIAIFMGIVMGLPLPLLPIQILWVNLVTDGLPALALGMDEDRDCVMEKQPRKPDESIFAGGMVAKIITRGLLIGLNTLIAFLLGIYKIEGGLQLARTMAFSTLVFSQLIFVFSCKSEENPFRLNTIFSSLHLLGAVSISVIMQLAVIYYPFFTEIFKTTVLSSQQWVVVLVLSIWPTIFLELINNITAGHR